MSTKDPFHHPVDQWLLEKLRDFRSSPSKLIWDSIEKQLDLEDLAINKKEQRVRVLAAIGIISVLMFFYSVMGDYKLIQHEGIREGMIGSQKIQNPVPQKLISNPKSSTDRIMEMKTFSFPADEVRLIRIPTLPLKTQLPLLEIEYKQADIQDPVTVITQKQPFRSRLSIEPYFSKEFAGYNFEDNDLTGANGKQIEEQERTVFSASWGFYLNYKINRHWVLQTGAGYSWSKSMIDSSTTYAVKIENGNVQFKMNTVSGYGYIFSPSTTSPSVGDSLLTARTYCRLQYISIPAILSYVIGMKKFTLMMGAGGTCNFLANADLETDVYGSTYEKYESNIPIKGLKKVNFGMIVKTDLSYAITRDWGINLISSFKNTLGPININSALSAYPYNFGVGLGMTYHF